MSMDRGRTAAHLRASSQPAQFLTASSPEPLISSPLQLSPSSPADMLCSVARTVFQMPEARLWLSAVAPSQKETAIPRKPMEART